LSQCQLNSTLFADYTKGATLLPEIQKQAYEKFYESTAKNEVLDQKATIMIQLAASFVIGCYP
jgi:hypothetical protein